MAGSGEKVPSIRKTERTELVPNKTHREFTAHSQTKALPTANQKGERGIMQENVSLPWQGHAGGRHFCQNMRCPCRTNFLLCRLKKLWMLTIQTSVKHLTQSPASFSCSNWLHMAWTRIFLFGQKTGWMTGPRE